MHYFCNHHNFYICLHSSWIHTISNQNLHDHHHKSQVKHIIVIFWWSIFTTVKKRSRCLILPVSTAVWYIIYLNVEIRQWSYFQRLKPILKCLKTSHGNIAVTVLSTVCVHRKASNPVILEKLSNSYFTTGSNRSIGCSLHHCLPLSHYC